MGCGSSGGQVTENYYSDSSTKPLRIDQMFLTTKTTTQMNKIYLFGQTQTKRKVLQLSIDQKTQLVTLNKLSQRYHIPRPKVQIDTIEMMYEQAQQVIPLNLYNSTTLPPFNQMFVTPLNDKVIFLCGGIDYQFWNVCAQSFLYKITSPSLQEQRTIRVKLQKPQTNILSQKQVVQRTFNKFQRLAFMNQGRYSHMGLSLKHPIIGKNVVYVFGGFNSNKQALKSCEMYSFDKNSWQRIPDMMIPRATGFCFHYIDKIYVCGGFSKDEKRSKKIEVFDLMSNSWSLLKIKLHLGIQQGFITSFKPNEIVIMGGNTQGDSTKSVIRYNLIEQTYKWDSDLIHSDSLQKGIHYYNKLFLFGGNNPNIYQVYDQKTQSWKESKIIISQEIKPGELTLFSSLTKSLFVDFVPWSGRKKQLDHSRDDFLIFGTDLYPLLLFYHTKDLLFSQKPVPMRLRLRKNMGILRFSQVEYFICGGIDSFQVNPTKATFNYNISKGIVQQLDKMPIKKYKFSLIKHKNHLYSIGGMKTNHKRSEIDLKDCCRYNILTKKWQKLPELNFRRSQCEVVEFQKGLLIFGGFCSEEWVQTVEYLCTQNQKPISFVVLSQKVPLVFPYFTKLISHNKNMIRLFILNRNIHTSNFQSIYFNINLQNIQVKDVPNFPFGQKKKVKAVQLNKLEQFDSIDVIINERVKTIEKQQQSGVYKKKKQLKDDFQDKDNLGTDRKQKLQPTLHNIKQTANKALTTHDQVYIPKQQQIYQPQAHVVHIRTKQNDLEEGDNRKSEGSQIQDQRNQIQEKFIDDQQKMDEMSMQFEKLSVSGLRQNEKERKKWDEIDMMKSPSLQDYDQSLEYVPPTKISVKHQVETKYNNKKQNIINNQKNQPVHEFVELQLSQIVKGLQIVSNPNQWIKIEQKCSGTDRVLFIRGTQVVKCSIVFSNNQEVKLNVTKETYQSSDILMGDTNNNQTYQTKITALQLTQNYA